MQCFILGDNSYKKNLQYHGCSLTFKSGNYLVQHPYDGYESMCKNIVEFNFVNKKYLTKFNIVIHEQYTEFNKSNKNTRVYDVKNTYFGSKELLAELVTKNYVLIRQVGKNIIIKFNTSDAQFVRLFSILENVFLSQGTIYKLETCDKIDLEVYNRYTVVISNAEIMQYTNNTTIVLNFADLLNRVNYVVVYTEKAYFIEVPYYRKQIFKQHIIADAIFSYYLCI